MKNIFSASRGAISFGLEAVIGLMTLLLQGQAMTSRLYLPHWHRTWPAKKLLRWYGAISRHLQEQEEEGQGGSDRDPPGTRDPAVNLHTYGR